MLNCLPENSAGRGLGGKKIPQWICLPWIFIPSQTGRQVLGVSPTHIEVGCAKGWKWGLFTLNFSCWCKGLENPTRQLLQCLGLFPTCWAEIIPQGLIQGYPTHKTQRREGGRKAGNLGISRACAAPCYRNGVLECGVEVNLDFPWIESQSGLCWEGP